MNDLKVLNNWISNVFSSLGMLPSSISEHVSSAQSLCYWIAGKYDLASINGRSQGRSKYGAKKK